MPEACEASAAGDRRVDEPQDVTVWLQKANFGHRKYPDGLTLCAVERQSCKQFFTTVPDLHGIDSQINLVSARFR